MAEHFRLMATATGSNMVREGLVTETPALDLGDAREIHSLYYELQLYLLYLTYDEGTSHMYLTCTRDISSRRDRDLRARKQRLEKAMQETPLALFEQLTVEERLVHLEILVDVYSNAFDYY